jgi:hypothetical protein
VSYFRGDLYLYLWNDGDDHLHIQSAQRDASVLDGIPLRTEQRVCLPRDLFDQLAVMRLAELIRDDRLEQAIDAAASGGNAGGLWLREMEGELKSRLRSLVEYWKTQKEDVL